MGLGGGGDLSLSMIESEAIFEDKLFFIEANCLDISKGD